MEKLILKCDKQIIPKVVREAAIYENRMMQGNKHIVHLEAFVIKFMCLLQCRLKSIMEGL